MSEITPIDQNIEEPENAKVVQDIAYPNIKSTIGLFYTTLLIWIIVAIAGNIVMLAIPKGFPAVASTFKLLFETISALLVINYALKRSKKQQGFTSAVNYHKIQWWLIPALIIAGPAFAIMIDPTSAWIPMPKFVREIFEQVFTKDLFSIATVVIIAPITEEILCRGIVLKGLLKNYPPKKAIITSAIFFSVMHLNPWQAIPAFFGGLFLGWLYYKTQSVITGMIFHAAINATAYIFLYFGDSQSELTDIFGKMYYPVLAVSILVFIATAFIINKKAKAIAKPLLK